MRAWCLSWNINGGLFAGPSETGGNTLDEAFRYIGTVLKSTSPDIVAFQEFPCSETELKSVENSANHFADYPYRAICALSPSHIRQGGRLGLAIFSKNEIVSYELKHFPTPDVNFGDEAGIPEPIHDKGILISKIQ